MTASNRATKYESLHKTLRKHFTPASDAPDRTVLEHLLYACCLEDARYEQADEAFAKLQQTYFDWNEVRVTTTAELAEALHSLPFSAHAAARIKQCLQALFESRYQYDIDDLKKANLGKAITDLEEWKGITPFIVSYVSQHALGGHSIPISSLILDALVQCEVITLAEAEKHTVPGIERAIPKNKGSEFASLVHQFAVELHLHPKSGPGLAVLKDLGVTYKAKPKAANPQTVVAQAGPAGPGKSPSKGSAPVDKGPANSQTGSGVVKKDDAKTPPPNIKKVVTDKSAGKAGSEKKGSPAAKSATSKAKDDAAKKGAAMKSAPAKTGNPKEAQKKPDATKADRPAGKSKPTGKEKSPPAKSKSDSKPVTKKGASPGKSSNGSSIASSITKKKPK